MLFSGQLYEKALIYYHDTAHKMTACLYIPLGSAIGAANAKMANPRTERVFYFMVIDYY